MTLQEQAEKLIIDLNLVEILSEFGEAHIVGNVAFGTTVKPDIDIQLYAPGHYEEVARGVTEKLQEIGLTEICERRLKRSKKYLITGILHHNDVEWALDVTMTQPDKRYIRDSYQFYLDYAPKMTDKKRELILEFKKYFADTKVTGDNSAFYIYTAVLDDNLETAEEIEKYFRSKTL